MPNERKVVRKELILGFHAVIVFGIAPLCLGQHAPKSANLPWDNSTVHVAQREGAFASTAEYKIDLSKEYSLAELIEFAEEHNPETHLAWRQAKVEAAALGISRSSFLPTLSAFALAQSVQQGILLGDGRFHLEELGIFERGLELTYVLFDFGERGSRVDVSQAKLLAANFHFNDAHRHLLFEVSQAYYLLIEYQGREQAARVALENAQTVRESAEERLHNGLGTLPDALEARSAAAQADLELQQTIGAEEIARGRLATLLALRPSTPLKVRPIDTDPLPAELSSSVEQLTDQAFRQRPDLLQKLEQKNAAQAELRGVRSGYFPTLSFTGNRGHLRAWGELDNLPGIYAPGTSWDARLSLNWKIFDGGRREYEYQRASEERRAAEEEVRVTEDSVAIEVWTAFSNVKTALRRRSAAVELLRASEESYQAALESYQAGVRNLVDLVQAQRTLAQARSEDISSRAGLFLSLSDLAFRTGELTSPAQPRRQP